MAQLALKKKKEIALKVIERLKIEYVDMEMTLNFSSAWELLIGGILGAQTTDEQVNRITDKLFVKYPKIEDYAATSIDEMIEEIRTVGLYRNKAKALVGSAKMIMRDFDGKVPSDRKELMTLPGVGPKVASLVRGDYYKIPAVVVDTHCGRIAQLLGLSNSRNPQIIERDLMKVLPEKTWIDWGHYMVTHGRKYCKARCRNCIACPLVDICHYASLKSVEKKIDLARRNQEENGCF
ncbi:MAG TPA: endonuclease III [Candidatus Eisenbacteria bacterium]|nr:endonuclease III [Candidatus Eisenbacteria bacterium]